MVPGNDVGAAAGMLRRRRSSVGLAAANLRLARALPYRAFLRARNALSVKISHGHRPCLSNGAHRPCDGWYIVDNVYGSDQNYLT